MSPFSTRLAGLGRCHCQIGWGAALLCLLLGPARPVAAQTPEADSLTHLLRLERQDTSRVLLLKQLSFLHRNSRPDQALQYAQAGIRLARRIGFRKGEGACLNNQGLAYWQLGNLPQALASFLAALQLNEQIHHRKGLATNLGNIGSIYAEQGEQRAAISYTLRARAIQQAMHDEAGVMLQLLNLGDSYLQLGRLDSAQYYTRLGYEQARRLNDVESLAIALNNLGNILAKLHRPVAAMRYYRLALPSLRAAGYDEGLCETSLSMAQLFQAAHRADSVLRYARLALVTARRGGFNKRVLQASTFLTAHFKHHQQLDSAFTYQELTAAAKDSLYSQEKVKDVQRLFFAEQMRQQQRQAAEAEAREARAHNLQLLGIAVFILTFALFLALFSRRTAKARTVELLGVTALLMVFEFVSLLLHPTIEHFTHHNPVLMLLALMGVASVLVPLHHKLEHAVKHRLLHRKHHPHPAAQGSPLSQRSASPGLAGPAGLPTSLGSAPLTPLGAAVRPAVSQAQRLYSNAQILLPVVAARVRATAGRVLRPARSVRPQPHPTRRRGQS